VISILSEKSHSPWILSSKVSKVLGGNKLGVPPPKYIDLSSGELLEKASVFFKSTIKAEIYSLAGNLLFSLYELKSQKGHLDWHHGKWTYNEVGFLTALFN
jgi:hypothetical protein